MLSQDLGPHRQGWLSSQEELPSPLVLCHSPGRQVSSSFTLQVEFPGPHSAQSPQATGLPAPYQALFPLQALEDVPNLTIGCTASCNTSQEQG